ncbi:MAG: hypothetical protein IT458_15935 [Planctomycetes bacterium]|nr:hypothetical protein [Planctomycetota bacterium]
MQALRILGASLASAMAHPRVLLTGYAVVTLPALAVVAPAYHAWRERLDHHPAAGLHVDQLLDTDLLRHEPATVLRLAPALIVVLVLGAYLSGGAVRTVATGAPFRYESFLVEGARMFLRSLRLLAVGLVAALLLGWGMRALDAWLVGGWLHAREPGTWLALVPEALGLLHAVLFLTLVFTAKGALAHLAATERRSALAAFAVASGRLLRHPLQAGTLILGLALLWLLGSHGFGAATVYLLDVRGQVLPAFATGQLGILWTQVVILASLLAARRLVAGSGPARVIELEAERDLADVTPPTRP